MICGDIFGGVIETSMSVFDTLTGQYQDEILRVSLRVSLRPSAGAVVPGFLLVQDNAQSV